MMNSSINDCVNHLKKGGHRIFKLMSYDEEDYGRIMEKAKTSFEATFTDTESVTHLPYSKAGKKFTMIGVKVAEGAIGECYCEFGPNFSGSQPSLHQENNTIR